MPTSYPGTIQTIPNPSPTDLLENATATLDHDYQHSTENDTIAALQAKVGANSSVVTTSHDYKLGEVTGTDKAVGKTATQTLTNKTLTSPQLNFSSDATGDLYYRNASSVTARLGIGSSGQILQVSSGGIPEWIANPSASDASTTVKGVVEIATAAQITAGTGTGETGALLVVPASAVGSAGASKLVQFDATGKYPAADGSLITNIPSVSKNSSLTRSNAAVTETITHGLGKTPTIIRLNGFGADPNSNTGNVSISHGIYSGGSQSCSYWQVGTTGAGGGTFVSTTFSILLQASGASANYLTGVVGNITSTTFDIVWSQTGTGGSGVFTWEAQ